MNPIVNEASETTGTDGVDDPDALTPLGVDDAPESVGDGATVADDDLLLEVVEVTDEPAVHADANITVAASTAVSSLVDRQTVIWIPFDGV